MRWRCWRISLENAPAVSAAWSLEHTIERAVLMLESGRHRIERNDLT